MTTIWLDTIWKFDAASFGDDITEWKRDNQVTWGEMAELSGHYEADGSLSGIGKAAYTPSMAGFLALCNLCELNPLGYFVLAD